MEEQSREDGEPPQIERTTVHEGMECPENVLGLLLLSGVSVRIDEQDY